MKIAVVTLDGFNEIDSFVASYILGRVQRQDWEVAIASPTRQVTSMNGVTVTAQMSTDELWSADAVIVGSGNKTRDYAADEAFLVSLRLDPARQLVGSQCSGALLLAKLGLLANVPVCTDLTTKPWVIEAGVNVVDRPFYASGNVATAGGCLSAQYRCVDHHPNRRCRRGPQRIVLCCAGWRKRPVHRPSDGTRAGRQRRGRRRFG